MDDKVFGLGGVIEGLEGDVDLRGTRRGFASDVVGLGGVEESVGTSRLTTWVGTAGSVGLIVGI